MTSNKKIILYGAGGHAKSIYSSLKEFSEYEIVGYLDIQEKEFCALKYIGGDECVGTLKNIGVHYAFVCVGSVGNPKVRKRLFNNLKKEGMIAPAIIDKTATVDAKFIGENVFIGKNCIVNSDAIIESMAIINSGAIVEHDCHIKEYVHVAPGAVVCGNCIIGKNTHIGAGSVVIQGVTIGENCIIGAGSVVVKDIPDGVVAFGNPCKVVRKNEQCDDNC